MDNTVITQPQGSNKKKLIIGGVVAVAVIGAGIYLFAGNQSLYKGAIPATPEAPQGEGDAVAEDLPLSPVIDHDAVSNALDGEVVAPGVPDANPVSPKPAAGTVSAGQALGGVLAATPGALAGPQALNLKPGALPGIQAAADAPAAPAVNAGKFGTIDVSALKNAPVIANPNLKQNEQAPAVAVAQPVVDNFGNANSYPEQPETLKRIKELEDALAAQDRARQAASAYGDNNNQLTPEQAAAEANRLAQQAAEARVAQADAMRNAANQSNKKPLQGGVIDADAIAQAEAANTALDASNSAGEATVTRTARVNAAGRTDATAAGRLHGAAIQGTSGPEVLLYPILVAAANGAYFSLRRRNKN